MNFAKILSDQIDWAYMNGVIMESQATLIMGIAEKNSIEKKRHIQHTPFSLFPYRFSELGYRKAISLAQLFNILVDKVSLNNDWITETLKSTTEGDYFTSKLMDIYSITNNEGISQHAVLGLHRSDYMMHHPNGENESRNILQVELNTISSSFGALSTKISEMHRVFDGQSQHQSDSPYELPVNMALHELSHGLSAAHFEYCRQQLQQLEGAQSIGEASTPPVRAVIMLVKEEERNFADQKFLQFQLLSKHDILCFRYTFQEVAMFGRLTADKTLLLKELAGDRTIEASVVYFRCGYGPEDYQSEVDWETRLTIERSTAIKCPNIGYHLAGTKKVQQALAESGALEKFIANPEDCLKLREVFAGLYSLEGEQGAAAVASALASPESFVLKPQREGGGHNYYGAEIVSMLQSMPEKERNAYILMERIQPPVENAILIRNEQSLELPCICELGVYGVYLRSGDASVTEPLLNQTAGHLLRVKPATVDEGGVAAGYAVLSSPILY